MSQFELVEVMPLENLLGPVGDLYCLINTFRMLVDMTSPLWLAVGPRSQKGGFF